MFIWRSIIQRLLTCPGVARAKTVGKPAALDMALRGKLLDADEAERIGLIHQACATVEELEEATLELALKLGGKAPLAMQGVLQAIMEGSVLSTPLQPITPFAASLWQLAQSHKGKARGRLVGNRSCLSWTASKSSMQRSGARRAPRTRRRAWRPSSRSLGATRSGRAARIPNEPFGSDSSDTAAEEVICQIQTRCSQCTDALSDMSEPRAR